MAEPADDALSPQEIAEARLIFGGKIEGRSACMHCSGLHERVHGLAIYRQPCPRIKAATWHVGGELLNVEYWPHGQWPTENIIFPWHVAGDPDEADEEAGA